ncbi:MAG: hypothetical protein M1150_01370 [Patescibacteria group bacterium]|nr:hypothetical protein [Patescibacteria group bacterium]
MEIVWQILIIYAFLAAITMILSFAISRAGAWNSFGYGLFWPFYWWETLPTLASLRER